MIGLNHLPWKILRSFLVRDFLWLMLALSNLLSTLLYKELDVKIHHAWDSFFIKHVNTKTQ